MNWFSVDKSGLAAILERRGKAFAVLELVSNAWDSGATRVDIALDPIEGKPFAELRVADNGDGFADLSHAHTLFAKSNRADKAEKRGRFNLGEKLVLSLCRWAGISTASGSINFKEDGSVRRSHDACPGTVFEAEIRMTRDELDECKDVIKRLIPPVETTFNGVTLHRPDSLARFDVKLPTEIADADGMLRRTMRTATVEVYEADGQGDILELGIPVVEADFPYRVNVLQKIPLNMERDNVTPAFLRAIQAAVLNHVHEHMTAEEAAAPWAQEAAGDSRASQEAVKAVIVKRFGDKAVVATPGDPMANANAEAAGYTVIPGGALSADAWANVRKHSLLQSTSRVFPTPTPEAMAKRQEAMAGICPTCGAKT